MSQNVDIMILGSGFGGSLLAMVLRKLGLQVALIERGSHPRFAVGESSTPTADSVLRDLCQRYDLPQLEPLTRYGSWRRLCPQIQCGLKRGFSYFAHQPGNDFQTDSGHSNELLVAASQDDASGDTHWYRADVDAFLVQEAIKLGVHYFDQTKIEQLRHLSPGWQLSCQRTQQTFSVSSSFLIDATGPAQFLPQWLGLSDDTLTLHTNSWSVFGHFDHVPLWSAILNASNIDQNDYPFHCDHAAQHHILDEGWMWQLRFANGRTSAGLMFDGPCETSTDTTDIWKGTLQRYPSLSRQFTQPQVVTVQPLQRTRRLQRKLSTASGVDWALMPHTYGFIDPLHSTGIAQTLCGIERLAVGFSNGVEKCQLSDYSVELNREFELIDRLVHGCYLARNQFPLLVDYTMLYFAAATTFERMRQENVPSAFLCSHDARFRGLVAEAHDRLIQTVQSGSADETAAFSAWLKENITPYNHVGLMDSSANNMYRRTGPQKRET